MTLREPLAKQSKNLPPDLVAERVAEILANRHSQENLIQYQNNPVGFGQTILGEHYTTDVMRLMNSVRDNPVTIARSSNGVGKTHGAARMAVWFYKCFPDSQVYTAAAPPEENLKRLLWGEIGSIAQKNVDLFAGDTVGNLSITRSKKEFIVGVTIP